MRAAPAGQGRRVRRGRRGGRRRQAVAALVSIGHLDELRRLEADLRETALILSRAATETGNRTVLDETIVALGFDQRT